MKMKKFVEEFKAFIAKGNVVDMAVAVIVGGAFSKIVTSLVNDIIMPVIGLNAGRMNVSELKWIITPASVNDTGAEIAEVSLKYGSFLQTIIDFLIISLCVFVMLKVVLGAKNRLMHAKEEEKAAEAAEEEKKPSAEELLTEIRDLLKDNQKDADSENMNME